MKIYFDDPKFDGQFLRALDYAPLGAQIGEASSAYSPPNRMPVSPHARA